MSKPHYTEEFRLEAIRQVTEKGFPVSQVAERRGTWPVITLCEALGVSPNGFYDWVKRPPSARQKMDDLVLPAILSSFGLSDSTYGARRIHPDVLEAGHRCGQHKIERIMRENGIRAGPKRRALPTDQGERSPAA